MNLDEIEELRRNAQVVLDEGKYFAGRSYVQDALALSFPLIQRVRDLEAELHRLLLELGHVRTLHDRSATEAIKVRAENKQLRFEAEKQTIIADILRSELQTVLGTVGHLWPARLGGTRLDVPEGGVEMNLDESEARANKATPGPWEASHDYLIGGWWVQDEKAKACEGSVANFANSLDADFIAHAREDVPALIAEVRRLREALRAAKIPHHQNDNNTFWSCPASGNPPHRAKLQGDTTCDCGADEHNARIDRALKGESDD